MLTLTSLTAVLISGPATVLCCALGYCLPPASGFMSA